jgi:phospholipase/carboxylesterase
LPTVLCLLLAVYRGNFGPDVDYINRSLQHVFERYTVDPNRLGIAGFSDGASYALSLGLPNGDLFSHIIAFSPGFMRPPSVVSDALLQASARVGSHLMVAATVQLHHRLLPRLYEAA